MLSPVMGEIVEWKSLNNGERTHQGVVVNKLDATRTLVRQREMTYAQVISTARLIRPRSVPTIYGPGKAA